MITLFLKAVSVPICAPHSRLNELDEKDLVAAGYQILTRSGEVGVDAFVGPGPAISLFFQGHPEYDADTLVREYLRDVSRFLLGEQAIHPLPPSGCFDVQTELSLKSLAGRAEAGQTNSLMPEYLQATAGFAQSASWRSWANQIYKAWLDCLSTKITNANGLSDSFSGTRHEMVGGRKAVVQTTA